MIRFSFVKKALRPGNWPGFLCYNLISIWDLQEGMWDYGSFQMPRVRRKRIGKSGDLSALRSAGQAYAWRDRKTKAGAWAPIILDTDAAEQI